MYLELHSILKKIRKTNSKAISKKVTGDKLSGKCCIIPIMLDFLFDSSKTLPLLYNYLTSHRFVEVWFWVVLVLLTFNTNLQHEDTWLLVVWKGPWRQCDSSSLRFCKKNLSTFDFLICSIVVSFYTDRLWIRLTACVARTDRMLILVTEYFIEIIQSYTNLANLKPLVRREGRVYG